MQDVRFNLVVINVFYMSTLLERVYFLKKRRAKYVSIFLGEHLTPQMKIVTFLRNVILNQVQWFILVTFKNDIPENEVHELGDSRHTLSVYCGRYIRITSEEVNGMLNKSEWSYLMELAGSCINRQILKLCKLHDDLIQWRSKCFQFNSFCTPPQTNAIDFETLYDEIMHKYSVNNKYEKNHQM
jgi:hypothetical protein